MRGGERKRAPQIVALSIASEVCDLRATKTTLAVVGNGRRTDCPLCSAGTVGVDRRGDWRLGVPACGADGARMAWHLSEIYQVGRQHPWLERSPLPRPRAAASAQDQEASTNLPASHTVTSALHTADFYDVPSALGDEQFQHSGTR